MVGLVDGDIIIGGELGFAEQTRPGSNSVSHIQNISAKDPFGNILRVNGITTNEDGEVFMALGDPANVMDNDPQDIVWIPDGSGLLVIIAKTNNTAQLWKYNLAGVKIQQWNIQVDTGYTRLGTSLLRLDIACDAESVFYTDMGKTVFQFNIRTGVQGSNFLRLADASPYVYAAIKIHPESGVVVAMTPIGNNGGAGPRNAVCIDADATNLWTDQTITTPYKIYKRLDVNGGPSITYADNINGTNTKVWSLGCYAHFCSPTGPLVWTHVQVIT